jgi:nucleotide-binding universal stress UspA family protein
MLVEDPIGAVQRAIEENHIDLVVMNGTKDHSSSDMYTVSNYAKIIAKTAPCPVLLVKNQAQEQQQQQQ